jgi:hypothetical protein
MEKPCRRKFGKIIQNKIREPIQISLLFMCQVVQVPPQITRDLQEIFRLFDYIITEEHQIDSGNLESEYIKFAVIDTHITYKIKNKQHYV